MSIKIHHYTSTTDGKEVDNYIVVINKRGKYDVDTLGFLTKSNLTELRDQINKILK